jgi:hypothetical protein
MQPGATAKFGRQTAASRLGPAAEIRAIAPLGRAGVPEDLGLITALLASYEARWLDNVERTRVVSAFGSSLRRRRWRYGLQTLPTRSSERFRVRADSVVVQQSCSSPPSTRCLQW